MIFLKLNGLLYILVMAMAVSTDENATVKWRGAINYRSSICLVPLHYNLKMTLTDWTDHISGEFNATIYINCATQNIILRSSRDITIIKVKLKSANNGIDYTINDIYKIFKGVDYVVLNFVDQFLPENNLWLECGVYTLYVEFLNSIPHYSRELFRTWYTNEKGHEKLMVATLIQPRRARQLFPCWDEPELTATFNISVKHHKKSKVLSNMPIREYQPVDNDTIHTLFHTTPQMSTNDVAIIMYDVDELYEVLNSTKSGVNMWCRPHLIPHMKFAQYVAGNVTMYLDDWKRVKSFPKLDFVAIPNFENKIWQTWGLIYYNEADFLYNEELHPPAFKTIPMRSIVHVIIYQWLINGNIFHPFWSPVWLNEGFIMFFETDIIDKALPDSRMMDLFVVQVQHEYCRLNTHFPINHFMDYTNTSNILNINSPFPLSHIGAVVWRMLASVIGNAFWVGMQLYLNTRFIHFVSETPDDLWYDMQIVVDEFKQNCKLNVKEMMDIWTIQQYCPVLNVIRDYSSGRVKISKELHDKLDWKPYFIPVTYTNETNINFSIPHHLAWVIDYCLTQSNPEIEIQFNDKDKWIIFNIQQTGYYRVNYDSENWRIIARYLNSTKYLNIHVLNRAQIIDDAFHFAIEKKLNFSIFWELARYLSREKDYVAWYPMIKAFEYISNIFAFSKQPEDELPNVIKAVLEKIRSMFQHIDEHMYEIVPTDDDFKKSLKQELAKWGCIIDNASCLRKANQQFHSYSTNPKTFKILPGWQKWTYCNSIKTMDYAGWLNVSYAIFSIYEEKSDHKMLDFLSCSKDPTTIHRFLRFILPAYEMDLLEDVKEKHKKKRFRSIAVNIYLSILATHTKNTVILKEILENFEDIKDSRVSMNAAVSVMINNAYSGEQLNEIYKFAKNNTQQSLSNIEHKLRTRSLEVQNQLKFLESLFEKPNKTATSIVGGATTTRTPITTTIYKRPNTAITKSSIVGSRKRNRTSIFKTPDFIG